MKNANLLIFFGFIGLVFVLVIIGNIKQENERMDLWAKSQVGYTTLISPQSPFALPKNTPEPIKPATQSAVIVKGKASYYTWDGCLGCNPARKMANGEILDDNKATIALTPDKLKIHKNKMVRVKNLNNGKEIIAKVTDSGGFSKYNRIADVSLLVKNELNLKTDISEIEISEL